MQAIIIDCIPIVNPQFASIVGNNAESIPARAEDSHAASPTNSKMIASSKTRPPATRVPVVNNLTPTSHVWLASVQILATATLAEVEGILPEETMAIGRTIRKVATPARTYCSPSFCSVETLVPEEHASVTTMFEHLEPHEVPT
jgi:hypothetical protein